MMRRRRIFVTGLSGFVGGHLSEALSRSTRFTLALPANEPNILNSHALDSAIRETAPDFVIHLAAQSFVMEAFRDPRATYEINFLGTLNLLETLAECQFSGRMLFIGSGDEYGLVDEAHLPVTEDHPLRPRNPYAVSKVAAEALCFQWSQSAAFEIVMARPFNHIGPGQDKRFAVANFALQLAEIRLGKREPELRVGNVDVTRDFTDVRDVVEAYLCLLTAGASGEVYNVCSNAEHRLRDIISSMARSAGVAVKLVEEEERIRRGEQKRMRGCNDKLRSSTDWKPAYTLERSLADTLDYWILRLGQK